MRPRPFTAALLATTVLSAVLLTGCARDSWAEPAAAPTAEGVLREGFIPDIPPSPEATVNPQMNSWRDVHPSPGYRVVLLTAGEDAATTTLTTAIRDWADSERVDLRTVSAGGNHIDGIVEAMDLNPQLIITAGNDLIDALATVTPNHLDEQFLVVGAEVAEPTANVTAVDWTGAAFRGEGLGASSEYDPATFTAERCGQAVRAGVAAVLHGLTGVVLWIE